MYIYYIYVVNKNAWKARYTWARFYDTMTDHVNYRIMSYHVIAELCIDYSMYNDDILLSKHELCNNFLFNSNKYHKFNI